MHSSTRENNLTDFILRDDIHDNFLTEEEHSESNGANESEYLPPSEQDDIHLCLAVTQLVKLKEVPELPHYLNNTPDAWISYILRFLEYMGILGYTVNAWFQYFIDEKQSWPTAENEIQQHHIADLLQTLNIFYIEASKSSDFTEIRELVLPVDQYDSLRNDMSTSNRSHKPPTKNVHRTSLRIHLFWEICRLRIIAHRDVIFDYFRDYNVIKFPEIIARQLSFPRHTAILDYSQCEVNQALYQVLSKWNLMSYHRQISLYVNLLLDRMAMFFCNSLTGVALDDESLRQPLNLDADLQRALHHQVTSQFDTNTSSNGMIMRRPDKSMIQYGPNFEYIYLCQLRYFICIKQLDYYEMHDRIHPVTFENENIRLNSDVNGGRTAESILLNKSLNINTKAHNDVTYKTAHVTKSGTPLQRNITPDGQAQLPQNRLRWIPQQFFTTWCVNKAKMMHGKINQHMQEFYKNMLIPPGDIDWMLFSGTADDIYSFTMRAVLEVQQPANVKRAIAESDRKASVVLEEELQNQQLVSVYEWLVLKLINTLFGAEYGFWENFVVHRDEIENNVELIRRSEEPLVIQFFNRYRVYYRGYYYCDDCPVTVMSFNEQQTGIIQNKQYTIFNVIHFWIYLMFTNHPKHYCVMPIIENVCSELTLLQRKHAERRPSLTTNADCNQRYNSSGDSSFLSDVSSTTRATINHRPILRFG